jgi:hypothetical protein
MARLLDIGLTVLVVSTLAVPAARAESQLTNQPQTTQSQTNQSQPDQPKVGDVRLQTNKAEAVQKADARTLSERDRLIAERQMQRLIPPQE